jgi:NADH-quinone oxidoreductase subunit M
MLGRVHEFLAEPRTISVEVLFLVLLPLAAAVVLPFAGARARRVALWFSIVHLALSAAVAISVFDVLKSRGEWSPVRPLYVPGYHDESGHRTTWTLLSLTPAPATHRGGPHIQFYLGIDGFNIWLAALSSVMMLPAILMSWESIRERPGAYYGWLFLLQGSAIGAFLSFDVILFYVFFELTLIPSFFLIGRWGLGSGRRDAARKFFLYTFAGSLLTLVGLIGIVLTNPNPDGSITFSLPDLISNVHLGLNHAFVDWQLGRPDKLVAKQNVQFWLFLALMAGFLVKAPVWPFHTWLPSAYAESPTGVTILLSAILAKLGTFGIVRFVLPLTPDAAMLYGLPVVGCLAAFGIVYAALCAYDQKDIKLVVAYSSVSHIGFLVLGIFAFNTEGLSGALLHMVNHGLTTGALFALLGFLHDRYGTTQVHRYGGLMRRYPIYAVIAFVICLASIGLPGLNNFVSEMLMLAGLYDTGNPRVRHLGLAVVAAIGILLSAWYMLTMMQRVFFNPVKEPATDGAAPRDVSWREFAAFGPMAGFCLLLGLYPQPVLDTMRSDVNQLATMGISARVRLTGDMSLVEPDSAARARPPGNTGAPGAPAKQ